MKKLFGIFAVLLLVLSPAVAQESAVSGNNSGNGTNGTVEIVELPAEETPELEGDPGLTPDNPLWGIDVALDRIRLALATGPEKAKIGLQIAEERLLEVRAMAEAGNSEAADKAEKAHSESLAGVAEDVEAFDETADEETISELEDQIDKQLSALALLRQRIENSNLPGDAKARLRAKFVEADGTSEQIIAKVDNKRTRLRIKKEAEGLKEKLEVKVHGKLTAEEKELVRELAKSIDASKDHARIKLVCKGEGPEGREGRPDCDFKVRGELTDEQSALLDDLISKLKEGNRRIKIEITHKFKEKEEENERECESDEDCEEGKFCDEKGECEDIEDNENKCETDEDCEEGKFCDEKGECEDIEDNENKSDEDEDKIEEKDEEHKKDEEQKDEEHKDEEDKDEEHKDDEGEKDHKDEEHKDDEESDDSSGTPSQTQ